MVIWITLAIGASGAPVRESWILTNERPDQGIVTVSEAWIMANNEADQGM